MREREGDKVVPSLAERTGGCGHGSGEKPAQRDGGNKDISSPPSRISPVSLQWNTAPPHPGAPPSRGGQGWFCLCCWNLGS